MKSSVMDQYTKKNNWVLNLEIFLIDNQFKIKFIH
jgi:hypothetical protein